MKKIISAITITLALSACSGSSVGIGAGTGFPGIGLGAGISLPIGSKDDSKDEAYLAKVHSLFVQNAEGLSGLSGKECTIQVTAAADGLLMDVKRIQGDDRMCDAVMTSFYKFNKLPAPPASLVDSLAHGMIMTMKG